jgi:hypothetical protein
MARDLSEKLPELTIFSGESLGLAIGGLAQSSYADVRKGSYLGFTIRIPTFKGLNPTGN